MTRLKSWDETVMKFIRESAEELALASQKTDDPNTYKYSVWVFLIKVMTYLGYDRENVDVLGMWDRWKRKEENDGKVSTGVERTDAVEPGAGLPS